MGSASSFFGSGATPNGAVKDPRMLWQWYSVKSSGTGLSTGLARYNNNTIYGRNHANFWAYVATMGDYVDVTTVGSYNTIVDVSGYSGIMANVWGSEIVTADYHHDFRITVDGTQYEFLSLYGKTAGIGGSPNQLRGTTFLVDHGNISDAQIELETNNGEKYIDLREAEVLLAEGSSTLFFESSLKVEYRANASATLTGVNYRYAGCVWSKFRTNGA